MPPTEPTGTWPLVVCRRLLKTLLARRATSTSAESDNLAFNCTNAVTRETAVSKSLSLTLPPGLGARVRGGEAASLENPLPMDWHLREGCLGVLLCCCSTCPCLDLLHQLPRKFGRDPEVFLDY